MNTPKTHDSITPASSELTVLNSATTDYPELPPGPTLLTVQQLCEREPALTIGGIRHLLFIKGHNIPGVYRFGRKLLFDRAEFLQGIKQGHTASIAGRVAE